MKTYFQLLALAVLLLLFTGCPYGYKFDQGKFPGTPTNMEDINSEYDDYNMSSPTIEGERYLYFSSNRNSAGADFDIVGDIFHVLWYKDDGKLVIDNNSVGYKNYNYIDSLFRMMNTGYDEFGPYSMPYVYYIDTVGWFYTDMIVYSNNESGNQDLKLVWFNGEGENPAPSAGHFYGPHSVSFLNSDSNDAYLSFYGPGFVQYSWGSSPGQITEILFCSDRGGNFDIYTTDVPSGLSALEFLQEDTTVTIHDIPVLNSPYNDKCPYVDGELLVFTSDRPGGYGGYDLYYSRRNGDMWTDPVNFGDKINTSYNEYRPILAMYDEFESDLMMFSSDRPGGKGGYDLYYVGIKKMIYTYLEDK